MTVSAIAKKAGLKNANHYIDATTIKTPEEMQRAVAECSVFGRVTPQQKKQMVQALQSQKHTVAMTGDGVNDVLALKEADCSCKQYQKCGIHVSDQNNFFGFTVIDHNFLWRCISL